MKAPTRTQRGISSEALERLREGMRGAVITPADTGYDEARRTWNRTADRRPAAVARCTGVADVVAALELARSKELPVAVRSGGHSLPGFSTCDDGIVIDLSLMKGIRVDPAARRVRAQPGLTLGEFDRETQQFGLATTMGAVSSTGITGLTLGGGLGFLMRPYGLACDNLVSADVVTADGAFVTASAEENTDLFWGLKGGGGNFGIVTSLEYRLHPVGPVIAGGLVAYPAALATDVLHFYREFTANAPDDLTMYAALTIAPDGVPVAALAACHAGPVEAGARALAPAKKVGTAHIDAMDPLPYVVQQTLFDGAYPTGQYHYWKSWFLDELTDEVIDILVERFPATTGPPVLEFAIEHLGAAVASVGDDASAFGHRQAAYSVMINANWVDPADTDRCIAWARETANAIEPHSRGGGYVNYIDDAGEDAVRGAYRDRYTRLQALKERYDPDNIFRLNQNVKPSRPT